MNLKCSHIDRLGLLLVFSMTSVSQAGIVYSGLNPTNGSTVDASDGPTATTYSGTWSETITGATGSWSLGITFNSAVLTEALIWEVGNAGSSATVGDPTGTGGGLVLDFRGPDAAIDGTSNTLEIAFSMIADAGAILDDITYSVGPGNNSHPDWLQANINTGGIYTPDTDPTNGPQDANYDSVAGTINPSPEGSTGAGSAAGTLNHDWYVSWNSGTEISWDGDVQARDTHIFGASGVTAVPEPSSSLLLLLGGLVTVGRRRR